MIHKHHLLLGLALLFPAVSAEAVTSGSKPPNFILILADDLGYGDLGVTGSKQIPTPHIDSLAAEGMRFTSAYTVGSAIRTGDWKLIRLPDRLPMLYHLSADTGERNDLALEHSDRTRSMLKELGQWEVNSPNPVFREPSDWRVRHLKYYDSDYQMTQPE
jgi:arylsulfatase A-like enzyme